MVSLLACQITGFAEELGRAVSGDAESGASAATRASIFVRGLYA